MILGKQSRSGTVGFLAQQPTLANRLSADSRKLLCCPICHGSLTSSDTDLRCTGRSCGARFPIIEGVPILFNENNSIFSAADAIARRQAPPGQRPAGRLARPLRRLIPSNTLNVAAGRNYERFARLMLERSDPPRVLIVGGGEAGTGMEPLLANPTIDRVESDVYLGPRTALVCDAHDIPFVDEAFDGVIVQAVLEHVVDPYRCVQEIHRVLAPDGLVYAETPFMQQVHMGRYDFTRFSHLGHRRLFRQFTEIDSGVACGPGTALAWSYEYFLLSFCRSRTSRRLVRAFASVTGFYLKYVDRYLAKAPAALDAASGYYFLGRKSEEALPDRELLKMYRGAFQGR